MNVPGVKMKKRGFSLIELVVVVAIIAIISASLVISFSSLSGTRLDAEARKIVTDISWARARAAAMHTHQAISFDPVNRRYSVFRSPTGTTADFTDSNLLKRVMVGVSLSLIQTSLWIYSPRGNISGPDTITLDYGGRSKRVKVFSDTGHARIE